MATIPKGIVQNGFYSVCPIQSLDCGRPKLNIEQAITVQNKLTNIYNERVKILIS